MLRRWLASSVLVAGCGDPIAEPVLATPDGSSDAGSPGEEPEPATDPLPGEDEPEPGREPGDDDEPSDDEPEPPPVPSDEPLPPGLFADVTEAIGIEAPHEPGGGITGQAWGDFDRDGWLDLFVSGGLGPSWLFRNRADGTFESVPIEAELGRPGLPKTGVTWADYDNDGWLDVYVAALGPNVLLHNEGGRALVPVEAGVEHEGHGRGVAWADYDGDGWLDLYLVNGGDDPDALYRGRPDGTFDDVSELVALPFAKPAYAATWTDYDGDGDLDLYVVNDHHTGNDLWRNDGPGIEPSWQFTNVSEATGAGLQVDAMGIAVGDFDEDGDLDLFSSDIDRTNLLRNELAQGFAGFTEVADAVGVSHPSVNWGASWLDMDLDGWLDLYLATQHDEPFALTNRLYRNRGNGTFEDASVGCGCADPGWTTGVAAGDYDRDGGVDLVVGNYGSGFAVYRNEVAARSGRHFVTIELRGHAPINRDAIGARVEVLDSQGHRRIAERRSGSSVGSGDMLPLHFGLGSARVRQVEVRWPDGTSSVHRGGPTDGEWIIDYPG